MKKQPDSKILLLSCSTLLISWTYLHYLANNLKFFDFDFRSLILLFPTILIFGILSFFNRFAIRKILITSFMTGGILFFMTYPLFSKIMRQYVGPVQNYFPQFVFGMLMLWIACFLFFYKFPYRVILIFLGALNFSAVVNLYQEIYSKSFDFYQESYKDIHFKYRANIYLLLTDAYPSLTTFDLLSNFDNQSFYNDLKIAGFKTYPDAHSSHSGTALSMSTIFLMKDHQGKISGNETEKVFLGENPVTHILKNNGYTFYANYGCVQGILEHVRCLNDTINLTYDVPFKESIRNYFKLYTGEFISNILFGIKPTMREQHTPNIHTKNITSIQNDSQKYFVYSHDVYLGVCGKMKESILCHNEDMKQAISLLSKDSIVIVMSDHGDSRGLGVDQSNTYGEHVQKFLGILMAIRWPAVCQDYFQIERITHANLFRYIFGCLQGKKIEEIKLVEDASYLTSPTGNFHKVMKNGKILPKPW